MCPDMNLISTVINLATLIVVIFYTRATYRLLAAQTQQGFENKFFQLLNLHHEIVAAIERYHGNLPIKGRRNFQMFYDAFQSAYVTEYSSNPNTEPLKAIQRAYAAFFESRQADIGHYFQNLYHVIKFVDGSKIHDKEFYIHVIRAQLSCDELLLLFYYCLSDYGILKFKSLVEKYSLFDNLPQDKLIGQNYKDSFDHKKLYDPRAFNKS